jgi:thioredoxin reductase (NADPH)
MESFIIWFITIIIIIAIITPYFIRFRRRQKLDHERQQEARSLGLDRPKGQFPLIDMSLCIGCGSCVKACPEEDVLGVVFGRAIVINGQRCVGHGYCETACPVGAIRVGLGDIKTRPDIPITNENYETNIPGIYIAGELGGLSLIRNAIEQGQAVISRIDASLVQSQDKSMFDLIIIGAGPAGISASLAAIKSKLNYLTLDQQEPGGTILQYPRQKLVMTQPVELPLYGWLKQEEYSKEFLLETWQNAINKFNINIRGNEKADQVIKCDGFFEVATSNGKYRSQNIVLAMGRRGTPRKLGIPGEDLPKTMYQLVDAQSFQNQHLIVVGGGDSAVEAAVGLGRQNGNKVTISYRQSKFARVKKKNEERINELISSKKIRPIFNSNLLEIRGKSVFLQTNEETLEIPNDFVFIFAGGEPPFKMLRDIGITFGGEVKPITPEFTKS